MFSNFNVMHIVSNILTHRIDAYQSSIASFALYTCKEAIVKAQMESSRSLITFEIESFVKGYHAYQYKWTPKVGDVLETKMEPTNIVDKYAVCVLYRNRVVGHLKRGKTGRFAKTIFYFLPAKANPLTWVTETACKFHVHLSSLDRRNM